MKKYMLVRSPRSLLKSGMVGHGWRQVDFSRFDSADDLINYFKEEKINRGRKTNQIKRFFNLSMGDIALVPAEQAVAVVKVDGKKSYDRSAVGYGSNRVSVTPFQDPLGNIRYVERKVLSEGLQRRLRVRQSVTDLDIFSDEIGHLVSSLESDGNLGYVSTINEGDIAYREGFKSRLLKKIRKGHTGLAAGGNGLERLVKHLFEIEGYQARILPKTNGEGIADVDIEATRNDPFVNTKLLVQVKHHDGREGLRGIRQLQGASEEDDAVVRVLITTADVSDDVLQLDDSIKVIDGNEFVEWLTERVDKINDEFRCRLGIFGLPALMD